MAHEDSITCLSSIEKPRALITAGFDRTIFIWSFHGQKLGSLVQGGESTTPWNFKIDLDPMVKEKQSFTDKTILNMRDAMVKTDDIDCSKGKPPITKFSISKNGWYGS